MRLWPPRRLASVAFLVATLTACALPDQRADAQPTASPPVPMGKTVSGNYLAGRHAQQVQDYAQAAEYLGRALVVDPGNLDLARRTFLLRLSEGRVKEAIELAHKIAATDANSPAVPLTLMLETVAKGDFKTASAQALALPKEGIQRFVSPLMIAWAQAGAGQVDEGIGALNVLDAARGFGTLKDFHAALIADFANKPDAAEASFRRVHEATPRPNWRIVDMYGNFLERQGKTAEAREVYEKFRAENPDHDLVRTTLARVRLGGKPAARIATAKDGLAEALFDLASLLNQRETVDLALVYGRLALFLRPDFPLAQLLVADIAEARHHEAEALAVYQSIDPKSPFSWTARLRAAALLDSMDKTDASVAAFKAMAAERTDQAEPLLALGNVLRGRERFKEAVAAYDGALQRIGEPQPRHWTLFYSRGVARERSGDWKEAEADLEQALHLQPEQPSVMNYLGYSWIDRGVKLEAALKMITRAVQLRPNDGYIVDSLGWAYYRLGDYPNAATYLEKAIELRPEDPTINDHLGDAYWQVGRQVEARNQWRRALQFKPDADQVKPIEAKLDNGLEAPAKPARGG